MTDRSSVIFGNIIPAKDVKKAAASKAKYARKFGDDAGVDYLAAVALAAAAAEGEKVEQHLQTHAVPYVREGEFFAAGFIVHHADI